MHKHNKRKGITFLKRLPAVVLALGLSLGITSRAVAQTCTHCPVESTASAIGVAFSIFAIVNGQTNNVSGETVGGCNPLILVANVSYNPNALDAQGNPAVGAGFVGGIGHILLPNGTAIDVTPADMATTMIGPLQDLPGITHCTAPSGSSLAFSKAMIPLNYTLTPADIAAGTALFTFEFTNGLSQLPNASGDCILRVKASPQQTVGVAPLPTCTVAPLTNVVCASFSTSFTVTPTGAGPFKYSWNGPAGFTSTNATITITNAQAPNEGIYTVTVTDKYGCVTSCSGTLIVSPNAPNIKVTKICPLDPVSPGGTLTFTGTVTNTGDVTLTNVIVVNDKPAPDTILLGPITLAPNAGTNFSGSYVVPLDSCGPYTDTVTARGTSVCGISTTNSNTQSCPGTNAPALLVTKSCPPGLIQPGQTLNITGTVTNVGNITLTNVTVTNTIAALNNTNRRVFGPMTLAPGAGGIFSDSYTVPTDSCGPYRDTVLASGADKCFGRIVTASDFKDCPGTNSPAIFVIKNCPPNPVPPGGLMVISGVVSNAGNITLVNVTVTNVITAIGATHAVLGPITLAPGQSVPFTDQYNVPLNSCGPYADTVQARGADKCFGRIVTASNTKICPGITSPRITIVKHCPVNPVQPGGLAIFSGTVSNAGNITLTNIIVVNNRPTNNTPILGPFTLQPGESTNFTGSEIVPLNCCEYFDTLSVVGANICTGSNVTASASAACPTLVIPKIFVTKNCPVAPVPLGQPLVFSGIVSNSGNIALINVTVVDNLPNPNTPVFGPITLAPGESAPFSGSYVVPINICDTNMSDTVTARGTDVCAGSNVTANASATCPIIPVPRLTVTKHCPPNPVAPGEVLFFTGSVSNSGNITITNVTVVNDRPAPNTPILAPTTLVPGQVVNFGGSYIAPYDCCGPCVDTLTARGNEFCLGSNVTATASAACPRITTPAIKVTRDCPPAPASAGELVFFTGSISNSGNATLGDVTVIDDEAGDVVDSLVLAPGESVPYFGMYIPTNCGASIPAGVTATGSDICTGVLVSNRFVTACAIVCEQVLPVTIFGVKVVGPNFQFSFQTQPNQNYLVQFTDSLSPVNWQPLTTVPGDGNIATITDPLGAGRRFYRVLSQ